MPGDAPTPAPRGLGAAWLGLGFILGAAACAAALLARGELRPGAELATTLHPLGPESNEPHTPVPQPRPAAAGSVDPEEITSAPHETNGRDTLGPELEVESDDSTSDSPLLVATARSTFIYEAPDFSSRRVGYLRAGQTVGRDDEASGFEGCPGGFFAVRPSGYVCAGEWASTDPNHPAVEALRARPDRKGALPYRYGISRFPTPPLYTRVPRYAERAVEEPDLHYHVRHQAGSEWRRAALDPVPHMLLSGGSAPTFDGDSQRGAALVSARAIPGSGFAFVSLFEVDGYPYGLSTDLAVLPLDRLTPVEPSHFHGLALSKQTTLPVAFVLSSKAVLETGDPRGQLHVKRALDFREALPLTGNRTRASGVTFHETRWGDWVRDQRLVIVEPLSRPPSFALEGRRWLDVSILNQTLVAYQGTEPVFVTLVSTGRDGLANGSHATVQGTFVIHTKHVTWNMGANAGRQTYDLREVPYVQYFHEGFALHGTYWHDGFGRPRSHGCVNLSPTDARYLFDWTEPRVPESWHGAFGADGTIVFIHP